MLYRPTQNNQTDDKPQNLHSDNQNISQYGNYHQQHPQQAVDGPANSHHQRSILLDVPPETLTSITSHLAPPTLLTLGCVSSYLAHHVKEDNTWRRAYVCHFLGISPESDLELGNSDLWAQSRQISSATTPGSWKTLLLRREDGRSWREEFSWRYVMTGRWSRSRSTPTTHTPVLHSPISNVHLTSIPSTPSSSSVPQPASSESQPTASLTRHFYPSTRFGTAALLTASTQYGVVARSMPLSGRVLTGYLDARMGFGPGGNAMGGNLNGNPNAQFTPNVTACDVVTSSPTSSVSTSAPSARVVWGTRAGDLIFSTAPRAMDGALRVSGGAGVQVRRCRLGDEHEGMVRDVKFVHSDGENRTGRWAVSAGEDGRVKLWDAGVFASVDPNLHTGDNGVIKCIWSSGPMLVDRFGSRVVGVAPGGGVVSDKCVRAEASFSTMSGRAGVVVGVGESGDVHVWIGHASAFGVCENLISRTMVREIFVECPFKTVDGAARRVTSLHIEPNIVHDGDKANAIAFLVAYEDDPLFYRIHVAFDGTVEEEHPVQDTVEIAPFGDPNFGPMSVIVPYFGSKDAVSFVLVGDHMGCVSLYNWETSSPSTASILPLRTFEAHRDGASVTALWWDGLVLVTGSARGTTHVWDAISFAHLRSFVSPVGRIRGRGRGQQGRLAGGALALAPHGAGGVLAPGAAAATTGGREAVRHIVVNPERDMLVVAVGDTIMAWHAGVVGRGAHGGGKGGVRGRHAPGTGVQGKKKPGAGVAKYIGQYEMRQTIAESRDLLDAERKASSTSSSLALARRRVEHFAGLDSLGLSEAEAVEYVLMLSRDEAGAAAAEGARSMEGEEQGVFEGDFGDEEDDEHGDGYDFDGASMYGPSPSVSSSGASSRCSSSTPSGSPSPSPSISSSSLSSSSSAVRARGGQNTRLGMAIRHRHRQGPARTPSGQPILAPSRSNEKVQISSPWRGGEPMQAGEEYLAEEAHVEDDDASLINAVLDGKVQEQHFPHIPGSAGTSPGEERKEAGMGKEKGKEKEKKEKERKMGSTSPSLVGKGKGKRPSNTQKAPVTSPTTSAVGGGSPSPKSAKPKASVWGAPGASAAASSSSFSAVAAAAATGGSSDSPVRASAWGRAGAGATRARVSLPPAAAAGVGGGGGINRMQEDDEDADLRFALELSLVEARSRGEDV